VPTRRRAIWRQPQFAWHIRGHRRWLRLFCGGESEEHEQWVRRSLYRRDACKPGLPGNPASHPRQLERGLGAGVKTVFRLDRAEEGGRMLIPYKQKHNIMEKLDTILSNQSEILVHQGEIKANQSAILKNQKKFESVLGNQGDIKANQSTILKNQKKFEKVLGNQSKVLANQTTIQANQSKILANQKVILANQKVILAK
jgi:hypothetical protein